MIWQVIFQAAPRYFVKRDCAIECARNPVQFLIKLQGSAIEKSNKHDCARTPVQIRIRKQNPVIPELATYNMHACMHACNACAIPARYMVLGMY